MSVASGGLGGPPGDEDVNMKDSAINNGNNSLENSLNNNSSSKPNNNNTSIEETLLYENKDDGPFYVFVESESGNAGRMHPMALGKLLKKYFPNTEILSLVKNGANRIKIQVSSRDKANEIIQSNFLKQEHLKAYVPRFILFRQGIIRNVDTSLTTEDLMEEMKPLYSVDITVTAVRRFTRKVINTDGSPEYKPTGTIQVTFRGQSLPTHVSIYYVRCEVEKYVPKVLQCSKCLRFGHTDRNCKGKVRCSICAENHADSDCIKNVSEAKCVHCKGQHSSRVNFKNPVCPELEKQKSIKNLMVAENITFLEAKDKISSNYSGLAARLKPSVSINEPTTSRQERGQIRRLSSVRNELFSPTTPERNIAKKKMRKESPRNVQFLQECRQLSQEYQYQPNQFPNGVCLTRPPVTNMEQEDASCSLEFENIDKLTQFICSVFKNSVGLVGGKKQITQVELQGIIQNQLQKNTDGQNVVNDDIFSSEDDDI